MNIFNTVNLPKPYRSRFNLTHENNLSCQIGKIVPFFCEEVLPDDKWSVQSQFRLELAPLIAPLMHNIDVYQYFFYVPNYILSSAWNSWISQGEPADSPNVPYPFRFYLGNSDGTSLTTIQMQSYCGPGSLLDYLGFSNEYARKGETIPQGSSLKTYSALPVLAYHAIWLNYFRNENFSPFPNEWGAPAFFNSAFDKVTNVNLADWKSWNLYYRNNVSVPVWLLMESGNPDTLPGLQRLNPNANVRSANFMHDYFTASLPFTQRGPIVRLPLGETAPVFLNNSTNQQKLIEDPSTTATLFLGKDADNNFGSGVNNGGAFSPSDSQTRFDPNGTLEVDLSEATGISILDLRRFSRLQSWLEKNAVGGNTPGENLRNHFGVKPSDSSLDKPVFLGGGRVPLAISNVLQTSQATDTSPQANPSGYGRAAGFAGFRNRYFREHGWILGLLYVMPRSKYMQGTRRFWDRSSRFDYFWMEFERIGEQPVYNYEIYDDGTTGENDEIFGYNPRYADYKFIPSSVHGDFKTNLAFWHAARIFSARPLLNDSFLHLGDDINRIFAVSDAVSNQNCWFWIRNSVKVRRPMMKNPTSILG